MVAHLLFVKDGVTHNTKYPLNPNTKHGFYYEYLA